MIRVISMFLVAFFVSDAWAVPTNEQWPLVSSLHATVHISNSSPHVGMFVFSADGIPLYRILCHPGDFEGNEDGSYNHMFQCKLLGLTKPESSYDFFIPSDDWSRSRTRAVFNVSQIVGKCKSHAFYGSSRSFKARGMDIKLSVSHFWTKKELVEIVRDGGSFQYAFDLQIDISADDNAIGKHVATASEYCSSQYTIDSHGKLQEDVIYSPDGS